MDIEGNLGIVVTSYESDTPVLTHIFWGENLKEALGNAKAHLVTDFFFSSSFRGEMKWRDNILRLSVSVYGVGDPSPKNPQKIYEELDIKASEINDKQIQLGYERILLKLAKTVKL